MKVYLGADHAGTRLKETMKVWLIREGYEAHDISPEKPEGGDDYPDYAFRVAEKVQNEKETRGVLVCDTGIGMAIAANKVKGAYAALIVDPFTAKRAREHNNANIAVFGSELSSGQSALETLRVFLETPFSYADRHIRRTQKISYYDTHGFVPDASE